MSSKDKLLHELEQAAASMVQGSLSESTRQCGDPSCACAHDPASRHGPHLYFRYKAEGKVHSVYVPAQSWARAFAVHRTRGMSFSRSGRRFPQTTASDC